MNRLLIFIFTLFFIKFSGLAQVQSSYPIWSKVEIAFTSDKLYKNVLYDVKTFEATFTSPTGRTWTLNGFWDGEKDWKIRFCPDELGEWYYQTTCSDKENAGLHEQKGQFTVTKNTNQLPIYQRGMVKVSKGKYHLMYNDGTPFFWTGCTAWNGALKSTESEWEHYLTQRKNNHYNIIQFVTTQWRGCEKNAEGQVAFTGSGRISINPEFFKRIDAKTDAINRHGLVASPVLLWALQKGDGRHISLGYYLPKEEAVLLAKYIVARLQGNQVVWTLGGDGKYIDHFEERWKYIGRQVFGSPQQAPATTHPQGFSWMGEDFKEETWLDFVSYQSSHSNKKPTVNWINKGPMSKKWHQLPAKPILNTEPNYEEIRFEITVEDVRNASYWSIFATPTAGIDSLIPFKYFI